MKPEFKLAKKIKGPSQLERVRAARAMLDGTRGSDGLALEAFMAIFHPDYPADKRRSMVADVRARRR